MDKHSLALHARLFKPTERYSRISSPPGQFTTQSRTQKHTRRCIQLKHHSTKCCCTANVWDHSLSRSFWRWRRRRGLPEMISLSTACTKSMKPISAPQLVAPFCRYFTALALAHTQFAHDNAPQTERTSLLHFSGGVFKDPFFELDDLATAAAGDSATSVRAVWYRHSVSSSELGTWIRLGLAWDWIWRC